MSRHLHIGHRQLDILDSLERIGPADAAEIAADIGLDRRGTWNTLHTLVGRGFVAVTSCQYRLTHLGVDALARARRYGREPGVPHTAPRCYHRAVPRD